MCAFLKTAAADTDGALSFEWVLLTTLVVIGIVGGLAAARDGLIDELGDVAEALLAVDQSYAINFPLNSQVHSGATSAAAGSNFGDARRFSDCARATSPRGQVIDDVGNP